MVIDDIVCRQLFQTVSTQIRADLNPNGLRYSGGIPENYFVKVNVEEKKNQQTKTMENYPVNK